MTMRTLAGMLALAGVFLIGCGDDKKKDGAKDKPAKKDAAAKKDGSEANKQPKNPESVETVQYESYDAEKWRPDAGEGNPNAWKPQDSKATKAGSALFDAITRAIAGGDASAGGGDVSAGGGGAEEPVEPKDQPEPEKQP